MFNRDDENPYRTDNPELAQSNAAVRYTDLPRECPSCSRKFSEVLYKKLYPRRFRWITIAYFCLVGVIGFFLVGLFGWLAFFVIISMASWGMTFDKTVRVTCKQCGWSQGYRVRTRG